MDINYKDDKNIFAISVADLQDMAVGLLDRRLTDSEIRTAEKCIESGLSFGINIVFKAAIEEATTGEI